jgi:tryptophan-rich hypothetical protein
VKTSSSASAAKRKSVMPESSRHQLNPEKLLLSKWTAVSPRDGEKHFLVIRVINPEAPVDRIEHVILEAVLSRRSFTLPWSELTDKQKWLQGWL